MRGGARNIFFLTFQLLFNITQLLHFKIQDDKEMSNELKICVNIGIYLTRCQVTWQLLGASESCCMCDVMTLGDFFLYENIVCNFFIRKKNFQWGLYSYADCIRPIIKD